MLSIDFLNAFARFIAWFCATFCMALPNVYAVFCQYTPCLLLEDGAQRPHPTGQTKVGRWPPRPVLQHPTLLNR